MRAFRNAGGKWGGYLEGKGRVDYVQIFMEDGWTFTRLCKIIIITKKCVCRMVL